MARLTTSVTLALKSSELIVEGLRLSRNLNVVYFQSHLGFPFKSKLGWRVFETALIVSSNGSKYFRTSQYLHDTNVHQLAYEIVYQKKYT